jgi:hypothetical protein
VTELAQTNYLTPNDRGGYLVSASGLSSWSRCQLQRFYEMRARHDPDAPQSRNLSATVYGSVAHYALMNLEQMHHEGRDDALRVALATFEHYWLPENTHSLLGYGVEEWLPRQTWAGLKERGKRLLRDYYDVLRKDDGRLLALEYEFKVPIVIDGREHTVQGAIDRMALRKYYNKPYLSLEDFKTGKQPPYLRHNMQGTVYAWVTTQRAFWDQFPAETVDALERSFRSYGYDLFPGAGKDASRRFRWINLQEIKFADGGWRTERDYARMELAIDAYVRGWEAGVFSVNTVGEVCRHCDFRRICGGVGLPEDKAGAP